MDTNIDEESEIEDSECLRKNKNSLVFCDSSGDEGEDVMNSDDEAAIDDSIIENSNQSYLEMQNKIQMNDDVALIQSFKRYLPSLRKKSIEPAKKKRKIYK